MAGTLWERVSQEKGEGILELENTCLKKSLANDWQMNILC